MTLPETIDYLVALPRTTGLLVGLKIAFIIIGLLMAAWIVYLLLITEWFDYRFSFDAKNFLFSNVRGRLSWQARRWRKIASRLAQKEEAEHKLALLEAETFLEKILARHGFKGEHVPRQIAQLEPGVLSSEDKEELLKAHRLCDDIIHDPSYHLSLEAAKKAVTAFGKVIQALTGLDLG